jgi:hypothetical protein
MTWASLHSYASHRQHLVDPGSPSGLAAPPSTCISAHNQCRSSTPAPTRPRMPHLSVVPLPSARTLQLQHTTAVRRGAASCQAVLRSCPVTAAAGVVTAEPSWVAERRRRCNPSEVCAASRRSPSFVAVEGVRTPATPFVALSASSVPPCGRTSVQLVGRTSGVQASGVRTDRRPGSAACAAGLSAPRWTPGVAPISRRVGYLAPAGEARVPEDSRW